MDSQQDSGERYVFLGAAFSRGSSVLEAFAVLALDFGVLEVCCSAVSLDVSCASKSLTVAKYLLLGSLVDPTLEGFVSEDSLGGTLSCELEFD